MPILTDLVNVRGMTTAQILRAARLRDLLASIDAWQDSHGSERGYWRGVFRYRYREFRRFHREPERAAFQRAVARSRA